MTLLEMMKTGVRVEFDWCLDGCLWYTLITCDASGHTEQFRFRIPLEDVAGGVFPARDHDYKMYMRWIRKELELNKAEAEMIAKARADWEAGEQ